MIKKTNFVVIFWLLLSLISFITLLFQLTNLLRNLATLVVPYENVEYIPLSPLDVKRNLIEIVPMSIIALVFFILFLRKGLKLYQAIPSPNTTN